MSDSKNRPPPPQSGPSLDDDEAPISEPRPSTRLDDDPLGEARAPDHDGGDSSSDVPPSSRDEGEPANDDGASVRVTRALTDAFLAKKATQARIRQVVEYRMPPWSQAADAENVIQEANVHALTTESLAKSVPGMWPWISTIAQNAAIDFCRANKKHLTWILREIDVNELPPNPIDEGDEEAVQPADDPTAPPRPVQEINQKSLHRWLRETVESKADVTTLEMIEHKAATGLTNAALAAEFGISEDAYDARLKRFTDKWIPRWEKHKRDRNRMAALLVLLFIAVGAGLWLLFRAKKPEPIGPTDVPVLRPLPTATVSVEPEPEPFNQAAPTDGGRDKPGR